MLTKNFHKLQTEVQRHVEADRVVQGSYATCFIGCLARGLNAPEFLEREYGIPLAVSRIAESIFEGLTPDEAPLFFAAFPRAVESDGKDLSRVVWQFLAAELRSLPPVTPDLQAVINRVIDGMGLLADGKKWSEEDARAAEAAARAAARAAELTADWAAARAAARAAEWAARAAAASAADWAAAEAAMAAEWASSANSAAANPADWVAVKFAVRRRQRDLLLKLIKEAPITQQQQQQETNG
jgi:hypothetical protein